MTVSCEACGIANRAHANFCIGCAAKLPGFAATGPSALEGLKARPPRPSVAATGASAADAGALLRLLLGSGLLMTVLFMAWYLYVTREASAAIVPTRAEPVVLQPAFQQLGSLEPDLGVLPEVSPAARAAAARSARWSDPQRGGAVDTVTRFYRALASGDGSTAATLVIAAKRAEGPFSGEAMTAFYGSLAEPLAIRSIRQLDGGVVEARYTYRATRTACEGRALITVDSSDPAGAIRRISANC